MSVVEPRDIVEGTISLDSFSKESEPIQTQITINSGTESFPDQLSITKAVSASPLSSLGFIHNLYNDILLSLNNNNFPSLVEATRAAHRLTSLEKVDHKKPFSSFQTEILLEPFILACQSKIIILQKFGIEGLSKLINYEYIVGEIPVPLKSQKSYETNPINQAIKAICNCFENETTDEKIQILIIQSIFTAISYPNTEIHQESLMLAIRTIYNIYLLSTDLNNQTAAQGTLVQIIRTVYGRIKIPNSKTETIITQNFSNSSLGTQNTPLCEEIFKSNDSNSTTLNINTKKDSLEDRIYIQDGSVQEKLSMEKLGGKPAEEAAELHVAHGLSELDCEINIRDGFLLFRALCKLTFKRYNDMTNLEMSGISLRSKILALYLILIVISDFPHVFTNCKVYFFANSADETPRKVREQLFSQSVKPYLGICLKSNFYSKLPKIFELNLAIFEGITSNLRDHFKWEIEACLRECVIPILESKEENQQIRNTMITILISKICSEPEMLKFIFVNYDCASGAMKSPIFQQLSTAFSKMILSQSMSELSTSSWDNMNSFQKQAKRLDRNDLLELPSLTSDKFTSSYISQSFFSTVTFDETWLQIRGIRCYQDIVESLLEMSGVQDDFFKFKSDRSYVTSGSLLIPGDDIHSDEFGSSISYPNQLNTDVSSVTEINQYGMELLQDDIKKGLQYLISHEVLTKDPKSISQFLLECKGLDKEKLGEFVGNSYPFASSILKAIVDTVDFTGLEFVTALRSFLNLIYLPGDYLKIDRLLLKFADKYSHENSTKISDQETAYILTYSVLMLNIQLHTPHFNLYVTKSDFIIDNRGIDHGMDLPSEILEEIYDQIALSEIIFNSPMNIVDPSKPLAEQLNSLPIKSENELISQDAVDVKKHLLYLIIEKELHNDNSDLVILSKPQQAELARRIFEVLWMPYLATISDLVRHHNGSRVLSFSLFGFRRAILLAGEVGHSIALSAFFSALCSYCIINSRDEMTTKIFASVVTMLDTAVDCGNPIKMGWNDVIHIVNRLVYIEFIPYYTYRIEDSRRILTSHSEFNSFEVDTQQSDLTNSQRLLIAVDRLIMGSINLSGFGIAEFISYFIQVASNEVDKFPHDFNCSVSLKTPRMFILNKLVELVLINMNRIRMDWKQIWDVVEPFFCRLGCHPNGTVGSFAVDSLYQMIISYLKRIELMSFESQKELLTPFAHILANSPLISIKELILKHIYKLIQLYPDNIRSGWETIVKVLGCKVESLPESLASYAFDILKLILKDHSDSLADFEVTKNFLLSLTNFVKCSAASNIRFQAIDQYEEIVKVIIRQNSEKGNFVKMHINDSKLFQAQKKFPDHVFWIPIFQCLMKIIMETKDPEVHDKSGKLFCGYFYEFGSEFPQELFNYLFIQSLFPFLTHMLTLSRKSENESQPGIVTLAITLDHFIDLFTHFFKQLFQFLEELFFIIAICLSQDNPNLCKIGADCLVKFLERNVERMETYDWKKVVSIIVRLFQFSNQGNVKSDSWPVTIKSHSRTGSVLKELKNMGTSKPLPIKLISSVQKINHYLIMTSLVEKIFLQNHAIFLKLNPDYVFVILYLIERVYVETQEANSSFDLAGITKNNETKKLEKFTCTSWKLEFLSLMCLFNVLLKIYNSKDEDYLPYSKSIEERLIPLCEESFRKFNELSKLPLTTGIQEVYQLRHGVVLRVGNFLCQVSDVKFQAIFGFMSCEVFSTLKHHHLSPELKAMLSAILDRVNCLFIHPQALLDTKTGVNIDELENLSIFETI